MRERQRAKRDVDRRAAGPRLCPACGGSDVKQLGTRRERLYYKCRTCGRSSFGDGPLSPPPNLPCPYCGGRCVKRGRALGVKRKPLRFSCTVCGRYNTNLWPDDTPSPGGPFPHRIRFGLNIPAHQTLLVYCQEHQLSVAQAIRDIFIRVAARPPMRSVSGVARKPGVVGHKSDLADGW